MSDAHPPTISTAPAPAHSAPRRLRGVPPERRRAIVVGASSGIGAALVRQLASEGYRVAALARRAEQLAELRAAAGPGTVLTRVHDVAEVEGVSALFEDLVRELGGLDLFVYAAGSMPDVRRDEYDTAKDLGMLAVNFGGCAAWCNAVARLFQTQRSGTLVGISSVAGDRGRKGTPMYGASKAAMAHYLEALRNRLAEVGVHVCTIKPGFVDTAMTRGKDAFWLISPEVAARTILSAARRRVNTRYVPLRWMAVMTVIRLIPSAIFRHLSF
jgi:short-subunit dehydrogenase